MADNDDRAAQYAADTLAKWLRGYAVVWINWAPFFARPAPRAWMPFRDKSNVPVFARVNALRRPRGSALSDWPD